MFKKHVMVIMLVLAVSGIAAAQYLAGTNYKEPGGARTVIQGSLDVVSGGELDVESGASLKIAGSALGVSMANGGTITNDTDNEIEFGENSEEFSFAFTANTVTFATDTAVDTVDMGVVDDLAGVGTVAFDAAASTITLPADGAADDLTVQVTGAFDASLILLSAGTGADAVNMNASGGGITVAQSDANILFTTATFQHKYKVVPVSYISATECRLGVGGDGNLCVGLTAGADEIGTTEGYVEVDDAADFLRFSIELPDDWVDTGTAADLQIEFDIHEQAAEECNVDVRLFEYGNTTPILTDAITLADSAARAFTALDTASSGIGADSDIDGDDLLFVEMTCTADTDDFFLYGVRLTYRVGIGATQ